jgi:hypothetical protein
MDHHTPQQPPVCIGILEIRRHIPVLHTFMRICDTDESEVTVFTTPELYHRLKTYLSGNEKFQLLLKEPHESIPTYLNRIANYCSEHLDVLLINTIHESTLDLLSYLRFKPRCKTILTIHHVNAWLQPHFMLQPQHPIMTFETNTTSFLIKHTIMPRFDAINVIYHPLKTYIENHLPFNKPIFTLPTSVYDQHQHLPPQKKTTSKLHITIPGLIQEQRKDYTPILQALQQLSPNELTALHISLPGLPVGSFGKTIAQQFQNLQNKGATIQVFDEFVPDETFNTILTQSNIILAPIKIQTRADTLIPEYYGTTVGSGVIYNAIQYAKPLIIPQTFNLLPELQTSALTYQNAHDLQQQFTSLLKDPALLQKLQTQATLNAEKFSLTNLQNYLKTTLLPWVRNK